MAGTTDVGLPFEDGEVVASGVARGPAGRSCRPVKPGVGEERVMVELGVLGDAVGPATSAKTSVQ